MRAILCSVDYNDLLALTLPANRSHFSDVIVVTSTADYPTVSRIAEPLACRVLATDLFYKDGADFNKWAALEFGLDVYRRDGVEDYLCIMDADIVWPKDASVVLARYLRPGFLYCPRRRMMPNLEDLIDPQAGKVFLDFTGKETFDGRDLPKYRIPDESTWSQYALHRQEREFAGYSQIFHSTDPVLGDPPWHDIRWRHAGGADSAFQAKWPEHRKIRPPFSVLHLGPAGTNWCGRSSPMVDGSKPEEAEGRYDKLRRYMMRRRAHGPGDPFSHEKLL